MEIGSRAFRGEAATRASHYGRTYDQGKKITWRDGVTAVALLALPLHVARH